MCSSDLDIRNLSPAKDRDGTSCPLPLCKGSFRFEGCFRLLPRYGFWVQSKTHVFGSFRNAGNLVLELLLRSTDRKSAV